MQVHYLHNVVQDVKDRQESGEALGLGLTGSPEGETSPISNDLLLEKLNKVLSSSVSLGKLKFRCLSQVTSSIYLANVLNAWNKQSLTLSERCSSPYNSHQNLFHFRSTQSSTKLMRWTVTKRDTMTHATNSSTNLATLKTLQDDPNLCFRLKSSDFRYNKCIFEEKSKL